MTHCVYAITCNTAMKEEEICVQASTCVSVCLCMCLCVCVEEWLMYKVHVSCYSVSIVIVITLGALCV